MAEVLFSLILCFFPDFIPKYIYILMKPPKFAYGTVEQNAIWADQLKRNAYKIPS